MASTALIGPVVAPNLHVMTFNIRRRMTNLNPRLVDRWEHRRPLLKEILETEQPALLGVQEALPDQASFVRHALGERYRSIGYGREVNRRGEGCPIFYDSTRLQLLDWRQTTLSETPDVAGSTTWGNRVPRVVVDATFRDIATGIEFQGVNTHFDNQSREARMRSSAEVRRIVSASSLPAIITGDFNTDVDSDPYDAITAGGVMIDCWNLAEKRLTDAWGTFLNYRPPRHERKRIDWILVTPGVSVQKAGINVTRYERGWPSDHAPVQVVVEFH
ncbi:endonuclease/exonuclease/phosphatase family protein [Glaciihabitans sp. UYNi722]|uniref:endonuclease/exonuclease/phosphatase family protein n=1 Tax=Glaciihabitans sp. UYNi722 TaxID=3156344 RepID=UPI0033998FC6